LGFGIAEMWNRLRKMKKPHARREMGVFVD
jgi:hypothetical protein